MGVALINGKLYTVPDPQPSVQGAGPQPPEGWTEQTGADGQIYWVGGPDTAYYGRWFNPKTQQVQSKNDPSKWEPLDFSGTGGTMTPGGGTTTPATGGGGTTTTTPPNAGGGGGGSPTYEPWGSGTVIERPSGRIFKGVGPQVKPAFGNPGDSFYQGPEIIPGYITDKTPIYDPQFANGKPPPPRTGAVITAEDKVNSDYYGKTGDAATTNAAAAAKNAETAAKAQEQRDADAKLDREFNEKKDKLDRDREQARNNEMMARDARDFASAEKWKAVGAKLQQDTLDLDKWYKGEQAKVEWAKTSGRMPDGTSTWEREKGEGESRRADVDTNLKRQQQGFDQWMKQREDTERLSQNPVSWLEYAARGQDGLPGNVGIWNQLNEINKSKPKNVEDFLYDQTQAGKPAAAPATQPGAGPAAAAAAPAAAQAPGTVLAGNSGEPVKNIENAAGLAGVALGVGQPTPAQNIAAAAPNAAPVLTGGTTPAQNIAGAAPVAAGALGATPSNPVSAIADAAGGVAASAMGAGAPQPSSSIQTMSAGGNQPPGPAPAGQDWYQDDMARYGPDGKLKPNPWKLGPSRTPSPANTSGAPRGGPMPLPNIPRESNMGIRGVSGHTPGYSASADIPLPGSEYGNSNIEWQKNAHGPAPMPVGRMLERDPNAGMDDGGPAVGTGDGGSDKVYGGPAVGAGAGPGPGPGPEFATARPSMTTSRPGVIQDNTFGKGYNEAAGAAVPQGTPPRPAAPAPPAAPVQRGPSTVRTGPESRGFLPTRGDIANFPKTPPAIKAAVTQDWDGSGLSPFRAQPARGGVRALSPQTAKALTPSMKQGYQGAMNQAGNQWWLSDAPWWQQG